MIKFDKNYKWILSVDNVTTEILEFQISNQLTLILKTKDELIHIFAEQLKNLNLEKEIIIKKYLEENLIEEFFFTKTKLNSINFGYPGFINYDPGEIEIKIKL